MLELRRLRLLRELHERGTVAAVADALQFTPSAVSQQLAMLEREAGVRLLERAGRGGRPRGGGRHRCRALPDRGLRVRGAAAGSARDGPPGARGARAALRTAR